MMSGTHTNVTERDGFPCLIISHYQTDLGCHGGDATIRKDHDLCESWS